MICVCRWRSESTVKHHWPMHKVIIIMTNSCQMISSNLKGTDFGWIVLLVKLVTGCVNVVAISLKGTYRNLTRLFGGLWKITLWWCSNIINLDTLLLRYWLGTWSRRLMFDFIDCLFHPRWSVYHCLVVIEGVCLLLSIPSAWMNELLLVVKSNQINLYRHQYHKINDSNNTNYH